jgi:hypothetical protein
MVHHGVDLSSNRYIWRCEPREAFQKDATDGPKDADIIGISGTPRDHHCHNAASLQDGERLTLIVQSRHILNRRSSYLLELLSDVAQRLIE